MTENAPQDSISKGYCDEYAGYFSPRSLRLSPYLPFFLSPPLYLCLSFSLIFSFLASFLAASLLVISLPFSSFLPSPAF